MDEKSLQEMVDRGMSMRLIAEATGKSLGSVRYWLKKYGIKTSYEPLAVDIEKLRAEADKSRSFCELIKRLGMTVNTSSYRRLRKFVDDYGVDVSHFTHMGNQNAKGVSNEQLFTKGTSHSFTTVKRRVIRDKLIPMDRCAICGMEPFWNGKPLTFRLDHINGNHYDNRLENLRFICANCDSQLNTFCHKNRRDR